MTSTQEPVVCSRCSRELRVSGLGPSRGAVMQSFDLSTRAGETSAETFFKSLRTPARHICPACQAAYCPDCCIDMHCPQCRVRVRLG